MFKKVIKTAMILAGFAASNPIIAQTPISTTFTGTPASCVITAPHSNAYFQVGKAVTINVYSTDIGGSFAGGTVSRVEFFNDNTFLGQDLTGTSGTYTFVWNCLQAGTYILRARAVDNSGNVSVSAGVKIVVGAAAPVARGLSSSKGKYFGNIIAGSVPQNYNTYWNSVSAENDCKWGSVERSRDVMTWAGADRSFNHAKDNNMVFRYHALAWGNQYPCWAITGQGCTGNGGTNSGTPTLQISAADFRAEIEEYMAAVATRYGDDIDQLDVLNENLQFGDGSEHAPATGVFRQALGGNGATGYDWVIFLFQTARKYFPNSKLILNDYGLENDQSAINRQLAVIRVLRDRNLIDGFGTQAHEFNVNNLSAAQLRGALDLMDNSGVPTYVTELDISGTDDQQEQRYRTLLPEYWNHPSVAGITLWGYIEGQTWITNTGLIASGSNGAALSPAMQYIQTFISGRTNIGYPYANQESPASCVNNISPNVSITAPTNNATFPVSTNINISASANDTDGSVASVAFFNGTTLLGTDNTSPFTYAWNNVAEGVYNITARATDNGGAVTTSSAVRITVGNPIINLLSNGEFNSGTTNWDIQLNNSTAGTITVVTNASMSGANALRICPTTAGNADWNVQVRQALPIVSGRTYEITYVAKADAARPMTIYIQEDVEPYTTYFWETVSLTTQNQNFRHTYTATSSDPNSLFKFLVGNNTACVSVDNVIVREQIVTSETEENSKNEIVLLAYPNPFADELTINSKSMFDYQILDLTGKLVLSGKSEGDLTVGGSLEKGIYTLIVTQNGFNRFLKIVKK